MSQSFRVLVCGGREYDDWELLNRTLRYWEYESVLYDKMKDVKWATFIEGEAKGADFLTRVWCKYMNIPYEGYPADWKKYGKAAGGIRNQQMLEEGKPDLVVAFPGGRGTADMIRRAKEYGVEVIEVK